MLTECFIGFLVIALTKWIYDRLTRKRCTVPGPYGLPLIGNIHQIGKSPFPLLEKWRKTYGDVYKINLAMSDVVVVHGEAIYEVLVTKGDDYAGRPPSERFRLINDYQDILSRSADAQLKDYRKIAHQGLRQYGTGFDRIEQISMDEIQDCVERFDRDDSFDPYEDMYLTVANIALIMLMGERFDKNDDMFKLTLKVDRDAVRVFGIDCAYMDILPWTINIPHESGRLLKEGLVNVNTLKELCFDKTKKTFDGDNIRGVFDAIFKEQERRKNTDQPLSDAAFKGISVNLILAAILTTSTALKSMIAYLLDYPDIQEKLHNEIDDAIGERIPTLDDRKRTPYMEAFILESLRYMSHIPFAIPHETMVDVTLKGYFIPKGTQVWTNLFSLHHDERYFPDPWTFKPDRFLDDAGELIPTDQRKLLMPFGAGRRVCVGEQMARVRIFLFMTTMLQRYEFLPEKPGCLPKYDPRDSILGAPMKMKDYKIRVKKRD
ncbi:unnamed protein product [Owenia fusiformis]|uniref:unspecific monooxygenase n=1 Tax=Owenia fusiformis TaxID=6347 RepID=A0A8J1Y702_OWEFU|nr:unnamed protein product [Owenia fusiformis]